MADVHRLVCEARLLLSESCAAPLPPHSQLQMPTTTQDLIRNADTTSNQELASSPSRSRAAGRQCAQGEVSTQKANDQYTLPPGELPHYVCAPHEPSTQRGAIIDDNLLLLPYTSTVDRISQSLITTVNTPYRTGTIRSHLAGGDESR